MLATPTLPPRLAIEAEGRWLTEIKLTIIELGQVGHVLAESIESNQAGLQPGHAYRHRGQVLFRLVAQCIELGALCVNVLFQPLESITVYQRLGPGSQVAKPDSGAHRQAQYA